MSKRWTEQEDKYLINNYCKKIKTVKQTSIFLQRTCKSISNRIAKLNLQKNKKRWTKKENSFLEQNVGILTHKEIAKCLNRTKHSVDHHVSKLKIKNRKLSVNTQFKKRYIFNENFFKKIDILNSYYAGLLAADGCIYKNTISLTQSECRLMSIKQFVKDINYNGNIYKYKHPKGYIRYTVTISSKKWIKDLKKNFNIVPKKSLILCPPKINNLNKKLSFIVGLIDGDGTVGFYNKKKIKKTSLISLCGTYDMTKWVFDIWKKECLSKNKRKNSGPRQITNNTWVVSISGIAVIKFYELIKNLNIPKMETKWDVFPEEFKLMGKDFYLKDFSKDRKKYRNGKFI